MTNTSVRDLVDRALLPLRAVDGALHDRAVDYVVDGAHPQVLSEVASFGEGPDECLRPACPGSWVDDAWMSRLRRLGIVRNAAGRESWPILELRSPLYRSGAPSASQWARLGWLLDAVHRTAASPRLITPGAVPAWLDVLLADVLCIPGVWYRSAQTAEIAKVAEIAEIVEARPGWNVDRVVGLLSEGGTGGLGLPAAVFLTAFSDAEDPRRYCYQHVRCCPLPAVLPGMIDYLAAHADALPASLMDGLAIHERRHVLTRMKTDPSWAVAGVHLLAALAVDASRELRRGAVALLRGMDPAARDAAVVPVLAGAPASRAVELVEFVSAEGGDEVLSEAARANRRLVDLIARIRARRDALVGEGDEEAPVEVPPFTPIEIGPDAAPVKAELRAALNRLAGRTDADARQSLLIRDWVDRARRTTDADLDALVAVADGKSRRCPEFLRRFSVHWIADQAPSLTFAHALRLHCAEDEGTAAYWWYGMTLNRYMDPDTDPRAVEELMARTGCDRDSLIESFRTYVFQETDVEVSWAWFAERPGLLREALGRPDSVVRALEILGAMPRVPAGLSAVVADIAVGDSKVNRPLAQAVLRSHPRVRELAEQALGERRAEARASAAAWVGSLGREASVPVLAAAVRKERREEVRAALLAALGECGGDLSEFLSPGALGAEAARGLKSKTPASLAAWFDFGSLPPVHWSDGAGAGTEVDPDIVRWWVVLADRLKDPNGRGIIALYLSLLEPSDAAALAGHVVRAWAERDARHPDPEESRAHAQTTGRQAYDGAQRWLAQCRADKKMADSLEWAESQAAITLEEHVAAAYAEHQRTYAGSAVADKGLLAFAAGMDDGELAGLVRAYMRDNPGRRAQFDALVRALYANGGRRALQVLLSIARRHKMAGVQATAAALVQETASERGWSAEELADRTVPTAGFDGDGLLRLSYGDREFTGRLTPDFKIEVSDETGRTRKSLPPARAGEDAEVVRAAKKRLTAARKEAREVLTLQSERLYEAMCASRTWPAAEWRELLAGHPLVGRLVTRLIWTAAAPAADSTNPAKGSDRDATGDADPAAPADPGTPRQTPLEGETLTFRPTEDGELFGADDAVVEFEPHAVVSLAHRVRLTDEEAAAWRQHLADYGVEPLFDQLSAVVPRIEKNQKVLTDLQGHMTDSFTLRAAALKRGYKRGEPMDAGFFDTYVKDFAALNLTAVLGFTGACLPEENVSCATTGLSFTHGGHYEVPLTGVPPVLLAECRADYAALAALGPYDPDWKKKAFM